MSSPENSTPTPEKNTVLPYGGKEIFVTRSDGSVDAGWMPIGLDMVEGRGLVVTVVKELPGPDGELAPHTKRFSKIKLDALQEAMRNPEVMADSVTNPAAMGKAAVSGVVDSIPGFIRRVHAVETAPGTHVPTPEGAYVNPTTAVGHPANPGSEALSAMAQDLKNDI